RRHAPPGRCGSSCARPAAPRRRAPPRAGGRWHTNDQSAPARPRALRRAPRDRLSPSPSRILDREADLQYGLKVTHLAAVDLATGLDDLEPSQVSQGFRGAADGGLDRILDAVLRGTGDLDHSVDVVFHAILLLRLTRRET